ncbi:type II toxin-antitoxin system PemK/MazF family toxin [Limnofasciculus baicalensis]|uniref:Type II toxin-antitoxin system PemK/MazF family toxin n=1 Tax=Limnofasciculus baicalensis BBK-W-15 TaxID=2699891 RepID=A0AAE3GPY9_9CYAN|nr:type II toxin-antitoxin system PemK/MazF family toxin [Limnofasciculus baicalensis]MCP2727698.1 type II toxin-antitoxin system PemK/MazF family toxin [Limnofasciculus baicalensis BBK-W-15]
MVDSDSNYVPERGDIVRINFNPQMGREQAGYRPAFILSPAKYNKMASLALICPITGKVKGLSFEVKLAESMETVGVVLVDHIKSLDWRARNIKFVEKATPDVIEEVLAKLEPLVS